MPADLAKRTPQETIQAVNQVSVRKGAVAARRLPSGDTIVTFQSAGARDWYSTNTNWVREAFGEQAEESKRTFAVQLKGVWKTNLQGGGDPGNGAGRFNLPGGSTQGVRRGSDLEGSTTGLRALLGRPQPNAVLQVLEVGAHAALLQGDSIVPALRDPKPMERAAGKARPSALLTKTKFRYGARPAEEDIRRGQESARGKSKVLAKAKEAYQFRPRTYETVTTITAIATHTSAPTFSFGAEEREDDSYQVVGRKRLRGRPTNVAAAQRQALLDPQQTRINFEAPGVRFASPVVSGVDTTALPPRAPEPATGPTPTAAANPAVTATPNQRDAEGDTTMDSITVAGDEN
ncbi:hypothetical protein CHGG_00012 [Chaetomium globosum CBS 148.51]|uniref:Uncharacterized protein n=1 Tax=Chaetomium globosum (strain ATCC 6205 / CBS 148.51 / DSM 1962 / NBRC 6347 / NRRL 1970) TaxID=306901 RepID=Q2HIE2_CHAGB|nr:uncharacterized protein CHGG_00012 [Chaetomium globosum CBS 148.51]EAQ91777.1 hypothetical protein CHGG_00012 [Chaetomium globosum CBS 148.51]